MTRRACLLTRAAERTPPNPLSIPTRAMRGKALTAGRAGRRESIRISCPRPTRAWYLSSGLTRIFKLVDWESNTPPACKLSLGLSVSGRGQDTQSPQCAPLDPEGHRMGLLGAVRTLPRGSRFKRRFSSESAAPTSPLKSTASTLQLSRVVPGARLAPDSNQRSAKRASSPSVLLSSLELIDTKVYEPSVRALLGTASHFCEVVSCHSWAAEVSMMSKPPKTWLFPALALTEERRISYRNAYDL